MNEALTNEVLEAMKKCNETHCNECPAVDVCCSEDNITIGQRLAAALLEERAKPKVWDGAPEWANVARVRWFKPDYPEGINETFSKLHTREPPKTHARQIAENLYRKLSFERISDNQSIDAIEELLNKYAEEFKGEA